MKVKPTSIVKIPELTGNGKIKNSRMIRNAGESGSEMHLEILTRDFGPINLSIPCSPKNSASMNFFMSRLIGEEVYYESGVYVESTSNRKLGQYSSFRMESGQFKGACFP